MNCYLYMTKVYEGVLKDAASYLTVDLCAQVTDKSLKM